MNYLIKITEYYVFIISIDLGYPPILTVVKTTDTINIKTHKSKENNMLVKAIHSITDIRGNFMPGDVFTIESKKEVKRLINLGAVIPARKIITIEVAVSTDTKES